MTGDCCPHHSTINSIGQSVNWRIGELANRSIDYYEII